MTMGSAKLFNAYQLQMIIHILRGGPTSIIPISPGSLPGSIFFSDFWFSYFLIDIICDFSVPQSSIFFHLLISDHFLLINHFVLLFTLEIAIWRVYYQNSCSLIWRKKYIILRRSSIGDIWVQWRYKWENSWISKWRFDHWKNSRLLDIFHTACLAPCCNKQCN